MTVLGEQEKTAIKIAIDEMIGLLDIGNVENHTLAENAFSRNRIVFGAPGTGKSFKFNQLCFIFRR